MTWLVAVIVLNFRGWKDPHILSLIPCLYCLYFYTSLNQLRFRFCSRCYTVRNAQLSSFYYYYLQLTPIFRLRRVFRNIGIKVTYIRITGWISAFIVTRRSDIHRGVATCIIKPANDYFASASKDTFPAELDITLDDFSSSNVSCLSITTGPKSLETRLIGFGYDFSMRYINI